MAQPSFTYEERTIVRLEGWMRTFGHPSVRNWGRPGFPAPTCALVPGAMVVGVGYLVAEHVVGEITSREASEPIVVAGWAGDDNVVAALTWPMTNTWSDWTPERLADAARVNVERGGGPFGNAVSYLGVVRAALAEHGVTDPVAEEYHWAFNLDRHSETAAAPRSARSRPPPRP